MTLVETLFGGTLLLVAMYFVLRLLGVSPYWRGVISGTLPSLAYIGFASRSWPGGDVVAVHLTVYLAAAVVLSIVGGRRKDSSAKLHWAPIVLIVFFTGLAVLMAAFMLIATRGLPTSVASLFLPNAANKPIHTGFSGVIEHDENAAKAVSQHLNVLEKQKTLGWVVEIGGLEKISANKKAALDVTILDRDHVPLRDASVSVSLQQLAVPDNRYDLTMAAMATGAYRGEVSFNHAGHWVVTVTVMQGGDKFQVMQDVIVAKD